ncbi:hydrolase Cof [Suicoccus acidiformans]|uniref:Hydrolase Cof n=1 Tax=Suicoccus acidiformans TaxID=2036206 RepID=A0A347WJZ8_9LACT|nr:Cof-type HAD-IIB family hydrolase [Suicoccus acidiformans]AXY25405.1 hydrolase Cof [Suicoccus acidiformans]
MIKLIAIDLDGTLLDNEKQISPANMKALYRAQEAGIKVVLCTGRPYLGMKNFIEEIGFTDEDEYIVNFNGGQVRRAVDGEVIASQSLSMTDMQTWYEEATRLDLPINVIDSDWVYEPTAYPEGHPSFYVEKVTTAPSKVVDFADFEADHRFVKFVITVETEHLESQLPHIQAELREKYAVVRSHPFQLEVMPKGVGKGPALEQLGEILGIKTTEMAGIGDEENDRSMLEVVGLPIAMGNATDEIKALAKHVTESNTNDGVAHAIDYILNRSE